MRTLKILSIVICLFFLIITKVKSQQYQHLIMIEIDKFSLSVIQIENNQQKEIKRYSVCVPIPSRTYPLPAVGYIAAIEYNPYWYPTQRLRNYYAKKNLFLPKVIRPNDPRNAMGKVKLIVELENIRAPIRIHGTNKPDSIGKRASHGCIRMLNKDALELANIIGNSKTKVIIIKTL